MKRFRIFSWDYGPIIVVIWFMISYVIHLISTDKLYSFSSACISILYLMYCFYLDRKYLTRTQAIRGYTYRK